MSQKTAIAGLVATVVLAVGGTVGAVTVDHHNPAERSRTVEESTYATVVGALNDEVARRSAVERAEQNLRTCAPEAFEAVLKDVGRYYSHATGQVSAEHLTHESCEGLSPATVEAAIAELSGVVALCAAADVTARHEGGGGWGMAQGVCVPSREGGPWPWEEVKPPTEGPPEQVWCPAGEGSWMSPEKIDAGGCD